VWVGRGAGRAGTGEVGNNGVGVTGIMGATSGAAALRPAVDRCAPSRKLFFAMWFISMNHVVSMISHVENHMI